MKEYKRISSCLVRSGICVIVKEIFNVGDFIMPQPFLSVLILTKNNQRSINYALMSVQPYADEIIVLDSGSQDKTLEIANRYTDKIYFREFEGHFGQQKNYGLSKCTGKWIFILDSDEFIGENFATTLKYLHSGFKCITMPRYHICSISQWSHFVTKAHYYDWQKRLKKNDSNIFYGNNKVHENLQNYSPRLHCAAGHIFHLDFLLHDYTARAKKSAFYDHLAGGAIPNYIYQKIIHTIQCLCRNCQSLIFCKLCAGTNRLENLNLEKTILLPYGNAANGRFDKPLPHCA
ncbi:MAG: glycosyltransferase family 2 protein [Veillonellaceae bacterium]|nr:glycosyltransferase family 2 protein [Veillonellaceae bacterium]